MGFAEDFYDAAFLDIEDEKIVMIENEADFEDYILNQRLENDKI